MQSKDHRLLGRELAKKLLINESILKTNLFVLGNVLPDRLPHTYLCRLSEGEKYRGHNFNNTKNKIESYLNELMGKKDLSYKDYVKLGILCHYLADAFTYPHNSIFTDTLKEHVAYEKQLHLFWQSQNAVWAVSSPINCPFIQSSDFLYDLYMLCHIEYEKEKMCPATDVHYIITMTHIILANIVTKPSAEGFYYIREARNPSQRWHKSLIIVPTT